MAFFLNSNFWIFPVDVFGNSQNSIFLGTLKFARVSLQKETLANFKVPKKVEFCELPKTSTGKIQKFELRKKAKELN